MMTKARLFATVPLVALLAALAAVTGCSSIGQTPAPPAPVPSTSKPGVGSLRNSPVPPGADGVVRHWVGVACPTVGQTAKTITGGRLVCSQSTSDDVPRWHVDVRTQP